MFFDTAYASLSDLRRFIRAGTIPAVIQAIAEDAGKKAAEADEAIQEVRTARFVRDESGDRLRAFWKPDGETVNGANERSLKKWMEENGLATGHGDIVMFLRDEDKADLRVRAVNDLLETKP